MDRVQLSRPRTTEVKEAARVVSECRAMLALSRAQRRERGCFYSARSLKVILAEQQAIVDRAA